MFDEVKNMLVSDLSILNPSSEEFLAEKLNCEKVAKKYGVAYPRRRNACLLGAYEEYAKKLR